MGRLSDVLVNDVTEQNDMPIKSRYKRKTVSAPDKVPILDKTYAERTLKNLKGMRKNPNRAKAMEYFDMVINGGRFNELKNEKKKIIGHTCIMVPQEFIIAAGAIPIRIDAGFFETMDLAEDVLPRDICPVVKSTFGYKILGSSYFSLCDAVVMPATCDAKKKLCEVLSDYLPVFSLEVPIVKDRDKYKKFWLSEIRDFRIKLEKHLNTKIEKKALFEATKLLYERTRAFRRLWEIRKSNPSVITEKDSLLIVNCSFYDDPLRFTQKLNTLCDELDDNIKKGISVVDPNQPRIMLVGSSIIWPNYKILDIAEESGLNIVTDQLCTGMEYLYQPVEVDEYTYDDVVAAIAERYLLPNTCPVFLTSDDRIDRILEMSEQFKVRGVIHHVLRLCTIFDMESEGVRKSLEENNVPVLKIVTDYSFEDVEQLRTRIEAFCEMIGSRGEMK